MKKTREIRFIFIKMRDKRKKEEKVLISQEFFHIKTKNMHKQIIYIEMILKMINQEVEIILIMIHNHNI